MGTKAMGVLIGTWLETRYEVGGVVEQKKYPLVVRIHARLCEGSRPKGRPHDSDDDDFTVRRVQLQGPSCRMHAQVWVGCQARPGVIRKMHSSAPMVQALLSTAFV